MSTSGHGLHPAHRVLVEPHRQARLLPLPPKEWREAQQDEEGLGHAIENRVGCRLQSRPPAYVLPPIHASSSARRIASMAECVLTLLDVLLDAGTSAFRLGLFCWL